MKIPKLESWPQTIEEATAMQNSLKSQVIVEDKLGDVKYVAGVDAAFLENGQVTKAAAAVFSFPDLQLVETAIATRDTTFPYIPGFLSFREIPAYLDVLAKLKLTPDLILCDGQGVAHPKRFGCATHLGVMLDHPTIGVAKSLLIGKHEVLADAKGSRQPLVYKGEIVGAVVRSRSNVKPLYVSAGHRICLETAIDYVFKCITKYRLPETTRVADQLSKKNLNYSGDDKL